MTTVPSTGPARQQVYTGRSTNWPVVIVSVAAAIALVVFGGPAGSGWRGLVVPVAVALACVLVNLATASNVRATAGPQGVTVHWGALGWPRMHYRLTDIASAEVARVPWYLVSWGLWWTPWRTTCTVRSGDSLRLRLRNGRIVTISVPQPADAVAAIIAS
jgi:hypothetical protein